MNKNFLVNLPHILWINLDKSKDRKTYMENQLNYFNLKNTRIDAYDGKEYKDFCNFNLNDISLNYDDISFNHDKKQNQIGCLCSHIKALEYFINTPTIGDYCLIAEDDLSFEYLQYWDKPFWYYIKDAPNNFEVIQLVQTYTKPEHIHLFQLNSDNVLTIKKHRINYSWGCVLYLVKRTFAEKMINIFIRKDKDGKYDLEYIQDIVNKKVSNDKNIENPKMINFFKNAFLIADVFMYAFNNAYTIPLFTTSNLFNSSISVKTKNSHTSSKEAITKLLIEYNNKKRMNNRGIHMFRF